MAVGAIPDAGLGCVLKPRAGQAGRAHGGGEGGGLGALRFHFATENAQPPDQGPSMPSFAGQPPNAPDHVQCRLSAVNGAALAIPLAIRPCIPPANLVILVWKVT
jgi:hypothetical protein